MEQYLNCTCEIYYVSTSSLMTHRYEFNLCQIKVRFFLGAMEVKVNWDMVLVRIRKSHQLLRRWLTSALCVLPVEVHLQLLLQVRTIVCYKTCFMCLRLTFNLGLTQPSHWHGLHYIGHIMVEILMSY